VITNEYRAYRLERVNGIWYLVQFHALTKLSKHRWPMPSRAEARRRLAEARR
jgi:hypothetical protein